MCTTIIVTARSPTSPPAPTTAARGCQHESWPNSSGRLPLEWLELHSCVQRGMRLLQDPWVCRLPCRDDEVNEKHNENTALVRLGTENLLPLVHL
ncbi:hypothetical protein SVAN01_05448 [Stagonosporopsis vannaccii]|nr:hypothetical protein SVAN01_05448 [Stagonosporopsis vannaccii]